MQLLPRDRFLVIVDLVSFLFNFRLAVASVVTVTTLVVGGCAATFPPPALPSNSDEVSLDEDQALDDEACAAFSRAITLFTKSVNGDSTATEFADAYRELAFTLGSVAIEAADDSEVKVALQELAVVYAAQADALINTGGLSTQEILALQTAVNTANDACGFPPADFVPSS